MRLEGFQQQRALPTEIGNTEMIHNNEAREHIATMIVAAKNGKRRGMGSAFRTTSVTAKWLAPGESAVGIMGGMSNMAIYSPAGARSDINQDRILFYGSQGVLSHEEFVNNENAAWFAAAFSRAA